ncbi:Crp/Fnr family transcriptional regulator [Rhizobium sp. RAF56]|jgi:CRP/FNR family transcriptional regulator|uniref:Crp/Fnr family transcriptional regulator n=1 Tax=Rhizobium sp. RAF56 TaxID=3233062 RepID=UPI003F957682
MDGHVTNSSLSNLPLLCRFCEGRRNGICAVLTPAQLLEISRHSSRRQLAPGEKIVAEGEEISSYHNVLRGVVALSKTLSDGRQQIVGLRFPSDFIGRPYGDESDLAAHAAVETDVCSLSRERLDRMAFEVPDLGRRLHRQALKELDEARDWLLTLGRKTAKERVASFLLLIAAGAEPLPRNATGFELPLSRAHIADFLGLTIETVSRQMGALRRSRIIALEGSRRVAIHDAEGLRRAAALG